MTDVAYKLSESIALFRAVKLNNFDSSYLKSSEFSVLLVINNSHKKIRAVDISNYLNCSKVYVSKIINVLLEKKLIKKEISETDKRQYYLSITDSGKEVVEKYINTYIETTRYLCSILGLDKSLKLLELLNEATKILNNIKTAKGE